MMDANELPFALEQLGTENMDGNIYFKDERGCLHIIDYVQNALGHLIFSSYENKDK